MVHQSEYRVINGVLHLLLTDGQGWWHIVKVSVGGENGAYCTTRVLPRIDCSEIREFLDSEYSDFDEEDERTHWNTMRTPEDIEWTWRRLAGEFAADIPKNREEDRCAYPLPKVLTMRPEVYIRKFLIPDMPKWSPNLKDVVTDATINSIWNEWAKDCPNP